MDAMLRARFAKPVRAQAVGVAAGVWTYGEAHDALVADQLVPLLRDFPELEPRFDELADRLGNSLAVAVEKQERRIERGAAELRMRGDGALRREREVTMSDRVPGAGLTEAEKREVAADEARWREVVKTPEFRDMQFRADERIASLRTGEVGRLDTRGATDVWVSREAQVRDDQAQRRAHEAQRSRAQERSR